MKYMLIMNGTAAGFAQYMSWPKKLLEANAAYMQSFTKKLRDAGELVGTYGLGLPTQAKLVTAGEDGKPVTDGVFPESKEFLAGLWIVEVDNAERAYELAAEVAKAPGTGGGVLPKKLWIEVREVLGSHKELV